MIEKEIAKEKISLYKSKKKWLVFKIEGYESTYYKRRSRIVY